MYDIKAIYEAKTIKDASRLLLEHKDAQIIAGGSDVLVQVREGKRAGKELVSIYGLDELRGVKILPNGDIKIGSLTSFSRIIGSDIIKEHLPVLAYAVEQVGSPQIRNIGTIGGNTCNGVTSADSASTLFAYDAMIEISGMDYERIIPISEFYISAGKVDLKEGEIQTAIIIKKESYEGYFGRYIKYAMREALDIATTGCSVNVKLSPDKKYFEDVRIAYGVAGPVPMRAVNAENFIKGKEVNEENIDSFANEVLNDVRPRDSWRASKAFRSHIGVVMAARCLSRATELAGGDVDGRL